MKSRLLAAVLAAATIATAGTAMAGPTKINSCGPISAPGAYVVKQNLSGVWVQACIEINASDVSLNLAGFQLDAAGAVGDGIRVNSPITT